MNKYKKNAIVKGVVTGIESYGVFVSLKEYYSGLIHISEISSSFVDDIKKFVKIGDTIYAKILEVDHDTFKVSLSIKNINYKVDGKRIRKPLKETGTGFTKLEEKLPLWIKEKLEEIKEK